MRTDQCTTTSALFVFLTIIDTIESLRSRENRPKIKFHAKGPVERRTEHPVVAHTAPAATAAPTAPAAPAASTAPATSEV